MVSFIASPMAGVVSGVTALLVFLVISSAILLLVFGIGMLFNLALSTIGLVINPALWGILGLLILIAGVFAGINAFFHFHFWVSHRLELWGMQNYFPELTAQLTIWTIAMLVSIMAWVSRDKLPLPSDWQNFAAGLVTLLALMGCVKSRQLIRDALDSRDEPRTLRALFYGPYPYLLEKNRDVDELIEALRHDEMQVRREAAKALDNLRDERAIPRLQKVAHEDSYRVKYLADAALVNMGYEEALTIFADQLILSSDNYRKYILEGMQMISPDAKQKVRAFIIEVSKNDAEEEKRIKAKNLLRRVKNEDWDIHDWLKRFEAMLVD